MIDSAQLALPLRIGGCAARNRVFLAPMSGITDRVFRERAMLHGAGLCVAEMVASGELVKGSRESLRRLARRDIAGPHRVQRAGNMLSVFFTDQPVTDFASARDTETWRFPAFFHGLRDARHYPPPSAFETWFVSAALDDDAFDRIAAALPGAARAAAEAQPAT